MRPDLQGLPAMFSLVSSFLIAVVVMAVVTLFTYSRTLLERKQRK